MQMHLPVCKLGLNKYSFCRIISIHKQYIFCCIHSATNLDLAVRHCLDVEVRGGIVHMVTMTHLQAFCAVKYWISYHSHNRIKRPLDYSDLVKRVGIAQLDGYLRLFALCNLRYLFEFDAQQCIIELTLSSLVFILISTQTLRLIKSGLSNLLVCFYNQQQYTSLHRSFYQDLTSAV